MAGGNSHAFEALKQVQAPFIIYFQHLFDIPGAFAQGGDTLPEQKRMHI